MSTEEAQAQKQLQQQKISREISALAEKNGCTLAQLVIAWCLKNDPVQCMLVGPTTIQELTSYLQALQVNKTKAWLFYCHTHINSYHVIITS